MLIKTVFSEPLSLTLLTKSSIPNCNATLFEPLIGASPGKIIQDHVPLAVFPLWLSSALSWAHTRARPPQEVVHAPVDIAHKVTVADALRGEASPFGLCTVLLAMPRGMKKCVVPDSWIDNLRQPHLVPAWQHMSVVGHTQHSVRDPGQRADRAEHCDCMCVNVCCWRKSEEEDAQAEQRDRERQTHCLSDARP